METEYLFENATNGNEISYILDSKETDDSMRDEMATSDVAQSHNLNEKDLLLIEVYEDDKRKE